MRGNAEHSVRDRDCDRSKQNQKKKKQRGLDKEVVQNAPTNTQLGASPKQKGTKWTHKDKAQEYYSGIVLCCRLKWYTMFWNKMIHNGRNKAHPSKVAEI